MALRKMSAGVILAIVAVGIVLTVTSAGLLSVSKTVSTEGVVTAVNLGVFSDSSCTQTLTGIDWGTITPGDSVTNTVYVKNTGNSPITMSMTTTNWMPSYASEDITISWTREGYSLNPDQVMGATLTLSVSSSIGDVTNFYVEIVITGTE